MKKEYIEVEHLTNEQLNYAVADILNHESRFDMSSFVSYENWQATERSFGNPIKEYCTNWNFGGIILESNKGTIESIFSTSTGISVFVHWKSYTGRDCYVYYSKSLLEASMKTFVASKKGATVLIPVWEDNETLFHNKLNSLSEAELRERLERFIQTDLV